MWIEQVPVFCKEDILIDPNNYENEYGQRTAVGWLKELFLFEKIDDEHLWITIESQKNYREALDLLRRECKIVGSPNDWEDKQTPTRLAKYLNKIMRKLGYTEIENA